MDEPLLRKCDALMKSLCKKNQAVHFLRPVDWKKMGLVDYPKLIKQPMDLGTVSERLSRNAYARLEDFANDARLVWVHASLPPPAARQISRAAEPRSPSRRG